MSLGKSMPFGNIIQINSEEENIGVKSHFPTFKPKIFKMQNKQNLQTLFQKSLLGPQSQPSSSMPITEAQGNEPPENIANTEAYSIPITEAQSIQNNEPSENIANTEAYSIPITEAQSIENNEPIKNIANADAQNTKNTQPPKKIENIEPPKAKESLQRNISRKVIPPPPPPRIRYISQQPKYLYGHSPNCPNRFLKSITHITHEEKEELYKQQKKRKVNQPKGEYLNGKKVEVYQIINMQRSNDSFVYLAETNLGNLWIIREEIIELCSIALIQYYQRHLTFS